MLPFQFVIPEESNWLSSTEVRYIHTLASCLLEECKTSLQQPNKCSTAATITFKFLPAEGEESSDLILQTPEKTHKHLLSDPKFPTKTQNRGEESDLSSSAMLSLAAIDAVATSTSVPQPKHWACFCNVLCSIHNLLVPVKPTLLLIYIQLLLCCLSYKNKNIIFYQKLMKI
jgi:hypothetical protein